MRPGGARRSAAPRPRRSRARARPGARSGARRRARARRRPSAPAVCSSGGPASLRPRPAHVEVDDLRACRQPRADVHLEEAVVEARAPDAASRPSVARASTGRPARASRRPRRRTGACRRPRPAWGYTTFARYPATELEPADMIERAHVIGAGRVGSALAARLRERGLDAGRGRAGARAPLRARPRDRRGRARRSRPARGSRTSAARRRSPRSTPHARRFGAAPAADVHARPRPRAARRRLRGRHRRDGRGA